jgi:hypothetical protein
MGDLPDALKHLAGAFPSKTDIDNYKTTAPQAQVLETFSRMKISYMADGMSEPEADHRVLVMLDAYGLTKQMFVDYFAENKDRL